MNCVPGQLVSFWLAVQLERPLLPQSVLTPPLPHHHSVQLQWMKSTSSSWAARSAAGPRASTRSPSSPGPPGLPPACPRVRSPASRRPRSSSIPSAALWPWTARQPPPRTWATAAPWAPPAAAGRPRSSSQVSVWTRREEQREVVGSIPH